jgi:hypothetical protein
VRIQCKSLEHTTLGVSQRINHNKRLAVQLPDHAFDPSDFQPGNYAKQNILVRIAKTTATFVDCHSALEVTDNSLPNLLVLLRHDRNGRVFFQAVDEEVDRLRSKK